MEYGKCIGLDQPVLGKAVDIFHNPEVFPAEQVLLPRAESYGKANENDLSACLSDYNPAAFFQPKSAAEVATFLRLAKEHDIQFAIRGGGQQPLEACSNIDGGIPLELGLITGVELKDGSVSVGAGEHWLVVYEKVQAAGLGVGGSRSGKGGIGGLSLSGGLSFFSSREGFICDNVTNFEAVTALGDIIEANVHENTDLWKALKAVATTLASSLVSICAHIPISHTGAASSST